MTATPPAEIAGRGVLQVPGGVGTFPSLTVRQNLEVASWLHRRDAKARCGPPSSACWRCSRCSRPARTEPAANLSGGQQQQLALGMAFLSKPRLLMIDELSIGLAPVIVEQLLPLLRELRDAGHHDHPRRAVGERRPHGGGDGLLHGEGRDPVLRAPRPTSSSDPTSSGRCSSRAPGGPRPTAARRPRAGARQGRRDRRRGRGGERSRSRRCRRCDLTRSFGGLRAVDDVSIERGARRGGRDHRSQRRRQDHAVRRDLRASPRRTAAGSSWPATTSAGSPPNRRAQRGLGRSFQDARLVPGHDRRRGPGGEPRALRHARGTR